VFKIANAPEIQKRLDEHRKRAVAPTLTPIRLVDAQGRPVSGAVVSDFFWRDADREPSFTAGEPSAARSSDDQGKVVLAIEIPGHLDGTAVFAIRQAKGRPLVGLHKVTREEIGTPLTITMHPACRTLFRIESRGLLALEKNVGFTPDGRRVVAVAMMKVAIWDVASGTIQDSFSSQIAAGSSDRLAISPDGRWLAMTRGPGPVSVVDIPPAH
jgi:hypothetical protein